jgi:hypothetical protein
MLFNTYFWTDHWGDAGDWAINISGISFSAVNVDMSSILPRLVHITYPYGDCYVKGTDDSLIFYGPNFVRSGNFAVNISAPLQYDFSGLSVRDMDGGLLTDLEIWCNGVRNIDAVNHLDLGPAKKTLNQWQGTKFTQKYGVISIWDPINAEWTDDGNPPDLLPTVYFWIDKDSAQAHELDGFAIPGDCYNVSFDHDGRIEIEGWFLSATNRSSEPWRDDIATIEHVDNLSIYADALEHTDWVGDGATTPDVAGLFEVTEVGGSLKLTLPSNYIARQNAVKNYLFDPPPIPVPEAYWRYRHDHFLGQGNPVEEHEAIYCWRGWSYLALDLNVPAALTEVTLTIEYYYNEYFSDNHFGDNDRQINYAYTPGDLYTASCTKPTLLEEKHNLFLT